MIVLGGGMMFQKITCYCAGCKKLVGLTWTRKGSPMLQPDAKIVPAPKPLGQIWIKLMKHACQQKETILH